MRYKIHITCALIIIAMIFVTCELPERNNPWDEERILLLPQLTTTSVSNLTTTSFTCGGVITSDGGADIISRGVVWSTVPSPTVSLNTKTNDGTGKGSFTSSITGLNPFTTYYLRAYATNSVGTAYGEEITETTIANSLPIVTTTTISSISTTSATSGGNVSSDGGASVTAKGVCWSTSQNPTIANSKTTNGVGTGSFTSSISGLTAGKTYYVRAYATNSVGTSYGNEVSFATKSVGVGDVFSPTTGKVWKDKNLGASRVATSTTDTQAYGDLYQWGRGTDGHEKRSSLTTSILSSTNTPGHGKFITKDSGNRDWLNTQNDNLWQGVNGINNPCPEGFRIPTAAEWYAEHQSWISDNAAGAFASPLKLPVAGFRDFNDGSLVGVGSLGHYWSSTVSGTGAVPFYFGDVNVYSLSRAIGSSVRCIKDD
jgi:hypothetical protein